MTTQYFITRRGSLILIILLYFIPVTAQLNIDSLRIQYNQKTFRLTNRITMNNILLETQTVKNLMLISPEATINYNKYLKNRRTANLLPLFGSAAVITGLFVSKNSRGTSYVLILSGNTINLIGSLLRRKANNYLQEAVWNYNRDVLYPNK